MRNYLLIIICLFCSEFLFSQEIKKDVVDDLLDEILLQEDNLLDEIIQSLSNYQFLYVNVTYNSNTYFSGRDIGFDQFNVAPQISYVSSKGFYAGISGNYYNEFYPKWDVTVVNLGFNKEIGQKKLFRYTISFAKYFYANEEDNILSNSVNLGVGVRNKERSIGTQITGSYLFGKEQSFQIASRTYASIKLVKTKKVSLKFRPQLTIIAGKQTIELARIIPVGDDDTAMEYIKNDVFELINTQINIPLQLSYNSFDFEVGYNYNIPNPIGTETKLDATSFFNISLAYLIDL